MKLKLWEIVIVFNKTFWSATNLCTIEMAREARQFFSVVDFMSCITVAKRPCYGLLKIKLSYTIVHHHVFGGPQVRIPPVFFRNRQNKWAEVPRQLLL